MKQLLIDRVINETSFRPHPDTVVFKLNADTMLWSYDWGYNHTGASNIRGFSPETSPSHPRFPFKYLWLEYTEGNDITLGIYLEESVVGINTTVATGVVIVLDDNELVYSKTLFYTIPCLWWEFNELGDFVEIVHTIESASKPKLNIRNASERIDVDVEAVHALPSKFDYIRGIEYVYKEIDNIAMSPVIYSFLTMLSMKQEIELVTYSRQVKRHIKRKTGKAPSPYFTIIDNSKPRKVYSGTPASTSTDRNIHRVRGHFRTTNDHPLDWFNGTKFIRPHIRGIGELQRSQYKVVLKD